MNHIKPIYLVIFLSLLTAGCDSNDDNKEYFPGPDGEKPAEFIYFFSKDYKLKPAEASKFFETIQVFAQANSMHEGEHEKNPSGLISKHFIAGPPMKFLLRVRHLGDLSYRVQISSYPGRACNLCDDFIKEVDSTISAGGP